MHVSGFATTGDPSWQIGQIGESFNREANVVWILGLVKLLQGVPERDPVPVGDTSGLKRILITG